MKRHFKIVFLSAFLAIAPLWIVAQAPPLPGDLPPDGTEVGAGAGAPVGNGTFILITLAVAYAVRKVYDMRTAKDEVTE